jgi:hypothetical protein
VFLRQIKHVRFSQVMNLTVGMWLCLLGFNVPYLTEYTCFRKSPGDCPVRRPGETPDLDYPGSNTGTADQFPVEPLPPRPLAALALIDTSAAVRLLRTSYNLLSKRVLKLPHTLSPNKISFDRQCLVHVCDNRLLNQARCTLWYPDRCLEESHL